MSQPNSPLTVSFLPSMRGVAQEDWNTLAEGLSPFMRWEWLELLESSGAVSLETGWLPTHCVVRSRDKLVAAAPLYLKAHGLGEFVYDQLWAEVASKLGLPYYPKLVAVSPFTPVEGYTFLSRAGYDRNSLISAMLKAMMSMAESNDLSGLHVLFPDAAFADILEDEGFTGWEHQEFLWENRGYRDFSDFLDEFKSGQRKNIRRERSGVREAGISVRVVEGAEAPQSWFSLMYRFYESTNDKFGEWGCKYLNRDFFEGLSACFRQNMLFSAAFQDGQDTPMAMAMLVRGADQLYGRYWGCERHVPFLHFELCYYAPIEWAIANRVSVFDPGMGGEHKPRRGFRSQSTRSMHILRDPMLAKLFTRNMPRLNALTQEYIYDLQSLSAMKRQSRS